MRIFSKQNRNDENFSRQAARARARAPVDSNRIARNNTWFENYAHRMPLIRKRFNGERSNAAATTCGNRRDFARTRITYLRGESRRVRIMSFNPRVPGYEGENTPAVRFRFAGSSARRFRTGNWISLPRGSWASFFGPAKRPFKGCRKILITRRAVQRRFPFYIWISERIGLRVVWSYKTRAAVSSKIKDTRSGSQWRCYANNVPFTEIVVHGGYAIFFVYLGIIAWFVIMRNDNMISIDMEKRLLRKIF